MRSEEGFYNYKRKKKVAVPEAPESQGPKIGIEVFPVDDRFTMRTLHHNGRRQKIDAATAKLLAAKMHENSEVTGADTLGDFRPRSAYFSITPDNQVCVEWGEIDPEGDAKLHSFLNRELNATERAQSGWQQRSGHIAEINIAGRPQPMKVALFDSIAGCEVLFPSKSAEYRIAMTFINRGIMPITTDGFPVQIAPRFAPEPPNTPQV